MDTPLIHKIIKNELLEYASSYAGYIPLDSAVDYIINKMSVEVLNQVIKQENIKPGEVSDGYHTFDELYQHRIQLFITLCLYIQNLKKLMHLTGIFDDRTPGPWKSKLHHDGSSLPGWFIAGIGKEPGKQISYHLPLKEWDDFDIEELPKAPKWDGHSSHDVLARLKEL